MIEIQDRNEPRRVVVTGAATPLGEAVAAALLRGGAALVCASDDPRHPALARLGRRGACVARVDAAEPRSLDRLGPADLLVHLAELQDESAGRAALWAANVAATSRMLDWAARAGVSRVVLAGSTEATGPVDLPQVPADESTVPHPATLYGRSKLTAERLALQWAGRRGVAVAVARLGPLVGAGQAFEPLRAAIRFVQTGYLRVQPAGELQHPVGLEDAARALLLLARDDRRIARCYHVTGAHPVTERDLFRRLAVLAGRETLAERVPERAPDLGERLHRGYSSARLATELGWTPKASLDAELLHAWMEASRAPREPQALDGPRVRPGLVRRMRALLGASPS